MINGYKKFKFQKIKYLNNIRSLLLLKLKKLAKNKKITFSNYHNYINDQKHQKIQWELAKYFRDNKLHLICFEGIREFLYSSIWTKYSYSKKTFFKNCKTF